MRPSEKKILSRITDKGITIDDVLEIIDRTSKTEMKKSFQDDCLFQTDKYFAKIILDSLLRCKLIKKEGNKFFKVEKKEKNTK